MDVASYEAGKICMWRVFFGGGARRWCRLWPGLVACRKSLRS